MSLAIASTSHIVTQSFPLLPFTNMLLQEFLLLILATLFLALWCRHGGARNLPPGPQGWPFVGNLFQVILQRQPFMYVVRDLRKKYGPIFSMQMGQKTLVILTGQDIIHEALVQQGALFANRPTESPTRLIFSRGKCAMNSAEYGPLWRTLRRNFTTEVVGSARVKQYGWVRKWALENHMCRVKKEAKEKGYVEVMSQCRLTICSIIICMCFGAKLPEKVIKDIECVLKEVMLMTLPKLPDFLPIFTPLVARGQLKRAKELRRKQIEIIGPLLRARKVFVESGINDNATLDMASPVGAAYVDSLLGLNLPGWPSGLGEEELVTLCSEVINAGTDTSATVVEWALLHLVVDQRIQEKLYEEIVNVVGKEGSVMEDHLEKMTYLNVIIKETMRCHPPSHFLLSHAATEDNATLGGYSIPKDAILEIYTAWMTQDPAHWSDPDAFRPERFLPGGEGYEVDWTGNKEVRMLPFGAGRRICPARNLGVIHVGLLLARMVHAYRWVHIPGSPPDPTETFAFTMVMKDPLKAIILPRC